MGEKNCFRTSNAPATQGLRCKRPAATPLLSSSLLFSFLSVVLRQGTVLVFFLCRYLSNHFNCVIPEDIPCPILAKLWTFISMVLIHKLRQVEGMDIQQLREQQNDHDDSMTDGSGPRPQVCLTLPHCTILYLTKTSHPVDRMCQEQPHKIHKQCPRHHPLARYRLRVDPSPGRKPVTYLNVDHATTVPCGPSNHLRRRRGRGQRPPVHGSPPSKIQNRQKTNWPLSTSLRLQMSLQKTQLNHKQHPMAILRCNSLS